VKDKKIQDRIKKMVKKIRGNPEVGKPLRYYLLGLRSIQIPPFRILYEFREDLILLHKFEHRNGIYKE